MTVVEDAVPEAVVEVCWADRGGAPGGGADAALAERLERFGCRALHYLNHRVEVSVLLCDSATMQSLNARYRGIHAPTDVLSFAQMESGSAGAGNSHAMDASGPSADRFDHDTEGGEAPGWPGCRDQGTVPAEPQPSAQPSAAPPPAGDVVISADVAARQAAARGEPQERELCRLLLHGMLHLAGMDHADPPREHEPMLKLQERTLHRLLGDAASTTSQE